LVLEIKRLLYDKRYTIEGARKYLENRPKAEAKRPQEVKAERTRTQGELFPLPRIFDDIKRELAEILALLS
jgi:hypothetical protein